MDVFNNTIKKNTTKPEYNPNLMFQPNQGVISSTIFLLKFTSKLFELESKLK